VLDTPLTRTGAFVGTPAYMAPEQMRGLVTDARTDQFSFCVALYEALYRERPFAGTDLKTLMASVLAGAVRPAPPDSHVPASVRKVLLRGLSVDPELRFPSMAALLEELQPRERLQPWRLAGAALLTVAVGMALFAYARHQQRGLCRGAERKLVGVWDEPRRQAVHTAFAATAVPYAEDVFRTVARALDDYTAGWVRMHVDACEATRLHGEQSEAVLDVRMTCLDRRLAEVASLTSVLAAADADTVRRATTAPGGLAAVSDCADVAALTAPTALPRDPTRRQRIEEATRRLADIKALHEIGKYDAASAAAARFLLDAKALGYDPLEAEAALEYGFVNADLNRSSISIPALSSAFAVALRAHDDSVATDAAIRLSQEFVYQRDMVQFDRWADISDALLNRTGNNELRRGFFEQIRCVALYQRGRMRERYECLRSQLARRERDHSPSEWVLMITGLAASDAGHVEEGVGYARRSVDDALRKLGADHPRTLEMRAFYVRTLIDRGDAAAAIVEAQSVLAAVAATAPNDGYLRGTAELYLGVALVSAHRDGEAEPHLEAAKQQSATAAEATGELARVARRRGDAKAALRLAHESLAENEKTLGEGHPDTINDLLTLARAEQCNGRASVALEAAERALRFAQNGDVSPFLVAEAQFLVARLSWQVRRPDDPQRARELAGHALTTYERAPASELYLEQRARVTRWLRDPSTSPPALD
jgi:hypothetical protein